jgi:hypothetical protein
VEFVYAVACQETTRAPIDGYVTIQCDQVMSQLRRCAGSDIEAFDSMPVANAILEVSSAFVVLR